MSDNRERAGHHRQEGSQGTNPGLPLWAPVTLIAAACVTGMLLGLSSGQLGIPYFALFSIVYVVCAVLVQIRGLLVTVCTGPILFAVGTPFAAMVCANAQANAHTDFFNKAAIATSTFAMVQGYLWLLVSTALAFLIAVIRAIAARRRLNQALALQRKQRHDADRAKARQHATMDFRQRTTNLADEAWDEDPEAESVRRRSAHSRTASTAGSQAVPQAEARRSSSSATRHRASDRRRTSRYGQTTAAQRGHSKTEEHRAEKYRTVDSDGASPRSRPRVNSRADSRADSRAKHAAADEDLLAQPARTVSSHQMHEDFHRRLRQERAASTRQGSRPTSGHGRHAARSSETNSLSHGRSSEHVSGHADRTGHSYDRSYDYDQDRSQDMSERSSSRSRIERSAYTDRAPEYIEELPPRSQRPRYRR